MNANPGRKAGSSLGGAVCIRNGNMLDFPWKEAVASLLPVCDEVVVCVGTGNEDNTANDARHWSMLEPKIKVCMYEWPEPKGDIEFWVKWINFAREHLSTDWHLQLDADEILHEKSYDGVLEFIAGAPYRTATCTRWNFYQDHKHTIPNGHCCGKYVNRIAPRTMWLPSDGCHPMGTEAVSIACKTPIEIFHYGFLRKKDAYFKKSRLLHGYFFDTYDPRLEAAEKFEGEWMTMGCMPEWTRNLDPFEGEHPERMKGWLKDRGYEC